MRLRLRMIASVCGTDKDPQPLDEQVRILEDAGVVVLDSNAAAVRHALAVLEGIGASRTAQEVPEATRRLVSETPQVVNVGLPAFAEPIQQYGGRVVQYTWSPLAGGNRRLQRILAALT